jgi:hypothetical protein
VLLAHPQINVNQKSNSGSAPFLIGCWYGEVEVVKILLRDSRVDINMADNDGCTPLWYASCNGRAEMIKWMIALRGDELDLEKKGEYPDGNEYTAIEVAREKNRTEVVALLERFMANPIQTRHEICIELGLADKDAAELFALIVFHCDDFLKIKAPLLGDTESETSFSVVCFFNIMSKLPMELQMLLCYRVYGSAKERILSKDSEPAFRALAVILLQQ